MNVIEFHHIIEWWHSSFAWYIIQ